MVTLRTLHPGEEGWFFQILSDSGLQKPDPKRIEKRFLHALEEVKILICATPRDFGLPEKGKRTTK